MEQPVFGNSRSQIWLQHWFVLTVRAVEHCAFLFLFLWPHAVVNSQWQKYDVAFMWHHAMILRLSFRVVGKKKIIIIKILPGLEHECHAVRCFFWALAESLCMAFKGYSHSVPNWVLMAHANI